MNEEGSQARDRSRRGARIQPGREDRPWRGGAGRRRSKNPQEKGTPRRNLMSTGGVNPKPWSIRFPEEWWRPFRKPGLAGRPPGRHGLGDLERVEDLTLRHHLYRWGLVSRTIVAGLDVDLGHGMSPSSRYQ